MKNLCKLLPYLIFISLSLTNISCNDDPIINEEEAPAKTIDIDEIKFTKGVNFSGWFLADSVDGILKTLYKKPDFEQAKSLGVDIIRLPIRFYKMTGDAPEYKIKSDFWEKLDYALNLAEEVGVNIIIDNHSYFGYNTFPKAYGEAQMTKVWEQVAQHCKDRRLNVYYELMNEPDGQYLKENWPEMQGRMIKAIRAIDSKHYIIVSATSTPALKDLPDYNDDKLIYTFHMYDPFLFTHQGAAKTSILNARNIPFPYDSKNMPECPESITDPSLYTNYSKTSTEEYIKNNLNNWLAFAKEKNIKLFCGEFGVLMTYANNDQRCSWYKMVREYLEENNIAWTMWDYHSSFGLFTKGSDERFETDLNFGLVKALGFTAPRSYSEDFIPDIPFYSDDFYWGMHGVSSENKTNINFHDTTYPYKGKNSIGWTIEKKWSSMAVEIWPVIDLSKHLNAGYHLKFDMRTNVGIDNLHIRFIQYQTNSIPWRTTYILTKKDNIRTDNEWFEVTIPLSSFKEIGTMDGNTWHTPAGLFNWRQINKLEFSTEGNEYANGAKIAIENIVITGI